MSLPETLSWVLGVDLGLASIAVVFASAWIRVARIDKIEIKLDELTNKSNKIDVLEAKIESIQSGIMEIKEILEKQRENKNV